MNDESNPEVSGPRPLTYEEVDRDWTETILSERGGRRYGPTIKALLDDRSLFVPGMSKIELESLRRSLRNRTARKLHSRATTRSGKPGRVLLLGPDS